MQYLVRNHIWATNTQLPFHADSGLFPIFRRRKSFSLYMSIWHEKGCLRSLPHEWQAFLIFCENCTVKNSFQQDGWLPPAYFTPSHFLKENFPKDENVCSSKKQPFLIKVLILSNAQSFCFFKLRRSEFYNNVCAEDRIKDFVLNQLKLKVNHTYGKDGKKTTNFELFNNENVANKTYPDEKLSKKHGHLSMLERDYNEFKLRNDKQSEEILIEKAVITKIQILYYKRLFDNYDNVDEVMEGFLFGERRTRDPKELNDIVTKWQSALPMSFNLSIHKYIVKKATSNIKIQQILSSLQLHDLGILFKDGPFSSDEGIVN